MKNYAYIGCALTKRGRTVVSVRIVQHSSDTNAVGGVLEYLSNVSDVESVLIFDADADEQICEVQV